MFTLQLDWQYLAGGAVEGCRFKECFMFYNNRYIKGISTFNMFIIYFLHAGPNKASQTACQMNLSCCTFNKRKQCVH